MLRLLLLVSRSRPHVLTALLVVWFSIEGAGGFRVLTLRRVPAATSKSSFRMAASLPNENETVKQIYGLRGSGWASPEWNWGSARGTGHDCATICRERWSSRTARRDLVRDLLSPGSHPEGEVPFAEVTLVLGLAWQNGRWDGSDGGPNGYAAVLRTLAEARRYEDMDEVVSAQHFIADVSARFETISRSLEETAKMRAIASDVEGREATEDQIFLGRRTCAGMVLDAIGFIEKGL